LGIALLALPGASAKKQETEHIAKAHQIYVNQEKEAPQAESDDVIEIERTSLR